VVVGGAVSDDKTSDRTFVTANELHIPVGSPVQLRLIGDDVIHSFWIPALAGKTDVIPGQTNLAWIEANTVGTYRGQCTEYCGAQHAHMAEFVIADSAADFKAWWDRQLTDAQFASLGHDRRRRGDLPRPLCRLPYGSGHRRRGHCGT
jgi:cytochrome c oxidase subunit 2